MPKKLKEGYYSKEINAKFATIKGFYLMFRPFRVPYAKLAPMLEEKKAKYDKKLIGMIESAPAFGNGWIGFAVKEDVEGMVMKEVKGDFVAYDHKGSYKGLAQTWRKIMKDYPHGKDYYTIYVSKPDEVEEKDLITTIVFKVK